MLQKLFPSEVVTVTATKAMWAGQLHWSEAACIQHAKPVRQKEFTAGRLCARCALKHFGVEKYPLLVGDHREPLWPRGILGSISHCHDYCGCAVTRRGHIEGIGFDVEPADELALDVVNMICTPSEKQWLDVNSNHVSLWSKLIFSAKESFYKAQFPLSRTFLDFLDVEIAIHPDTNTFSVRLLEAANVKLSDFTINGRFAVNDTHVFTATLLYRNSSTY